MPVLQTGQNVTVVRKRQSAIGTPASGSGGNIYRINEGSQGLKLDKAIIPNPEARSDGQRSRGRHGTKKTSGSYEESLSLTTQTDLMEAALRTTATATFQVLPADITSITTTSSTLVGASGSFLTKGVRKGDMFKLTNHSTAANNGKWIRVVGVSASTLTVPSGALVADAVADATFTIDIAKSVFSGATPTEYYYSIDEYDVDLDLSSFGTDTKLCKMEINAQPDQLVKCTTSWMGLDYAAQTSGASPVLTGTRSTSAPMVMADGIIRLNGVDYNILTGLQVTIDLGGTAPSVLAPNAPDVFLDNMTVSGSITALKQDLAFLTAFRAETPMELFVLFSENEADPKDFISLYIGNLTLSGADGPMGNTGPRSITVPFNAGIDDAGGASASTTVKFAMSA